MEKQSFAQLRKRLAQCRRNDTVDVICRFLCSQWRESAFDHADAKLLSVRQFANWAGVARQSVAKAYRNLEDSGVISRRPGSRIWHVCSAGQSSSRCIGLILPMPFLNYFMPGPSYDVRFGLFSGVTERAAELGYSIRPVYLPEDPESVEEMEKQLPDLCRELAGAIHFGERGYDSDPVLSRLFDCRKIPQVSMGCEIHRPWIGCVTFDGDFVMRTLVNTLRELGHSTLCVLYPLDHAGKSELCYTLCDRDEIHRALSKSGFRKDKLTEIITTSQQDPPQFFRKLSEILNRSNAPTAFWCRSEETAFLLIEYLRRNGIRVPEECSVVGFDDGSLARTCRPELTTFHYPFFDIGAAAVEKIDDFIRNGFRPEQRITRLLSPLVMRKTLGVCVRKIQNMNRKQGEQK